MCDYISWIRLADTKNILIYFFNRFIYLINDLLFFNTQYSFFVLFLGNKLIKTGLRELYFRNNIKKGRRNGIFNLRIDTLTVAIENPIFFTDGNPYLYILSYLKYFKYYKNQSLILCWPFLSFFIFYILYARFFYLFNDIIYIFANDFSGLKYVIKFLKIWVKVKSVYNLFNIRSRVIIAVSQYSVNIIYNFFEIKDLYDRLWKHSAFLKKIYLFIIFVKLAGDYFSPLTRYKRLKKVLLNKLNYLRQIKFYYRFLFSANYFAAFFKQALYYTLQSIF